MPTGIGGVNVDIAKPIPLEPIPLGRVPFERGRTSSYESLFQDVLKLDGLALPVQCESGAAARHLAHACQSRGGRGKILGIRAVQRDTITFLYCGNKA